MRLVGLDTDPASAPYLLHVLFDGSRRPGRSGDQWDEEDGLELLLEIGVG